MKKNIKILAIIFSVVLNIVFLGSYLYHKFGLHLSPGHQMNHNRLICEELNLSREQLKKFEPVRDRFHAFISQQGHAIKDKQLELIDLLTKENPDREAIGAKQKEIHTLQGQMQAKVIDHLLEEREIFTVEQREKFFALIKGRIEKSESPRPRWMPKPRIKPSEGGRP